ncbi:MAG UNVERIFIED_CONTAM: hypothetical protein LVR18_22175 [Planctomycetaceae bacterium]
MTATGELAARVNTTGGAVNETITLPSGDSVAVTFGATEAAAVFKGIVTAEVSGFATITGGFAISKSTSKLTIAAAGVTAFVGSGNLGVRVTNGKLGAVIKTDTKKFAAVASGDAALEGVSGLTVTGSGSVRLNKMGEAVNETITTPSGNVDIVFADGSDIQQISSTLNLQFENFVYASGDFLLEKTQVSDLTTITLAASNLNAFLGVNYGIAGEFGVKVTGAGVAMLIEKQGSNAAKYAISTTGGTVGLVGLAGVDLTGPLALNINRLGRIVDVDIPAPSGVTFPLEFTLPDTVQRFGGDLNLNINNFTTLKGTYGFEIETASGATEIRVAGTNINAVLGSNPDGIIGNADDVGARITNAKLGAVLFRSAAGDTSYALDAKGTASLAGVSGFTIAGDLAARVNTTGGAVNETITLPNGDTVAVQFAATEAAAVFKGIVTAEVSGFATITGGFAISKSTSKLTIAAAGVTAFVGSGNLGVRVTNGKLGAVIKTDTKKFAAVASGDAALEGVSGLTVTGSGSVRLNKMGEAVNETITTPSGNVDIVFADGTDIQQISSTLNLQFENFVYASGDFLLEKTQMSDLTTITLAASNLTAFLGVNYGIAGEFGVKVTGAGVAMLIEKQGNNAAKYAISTTGGTVGLVGLAGVDLTGPLALNINRLGRIVDVDIPAPSGVTFPLEFTLPDTVQRFGGDLNLNIAGFTTLKGTYGFEIETASGATEIRVAGTNINAVLGSNPDGIIGNADDVGARITNAKLGAVLFRSAAGATSYALDAKGTASLAGVSGFTLTGDLAARVNTTGGAVNESITLPNGDTVAVQFGATEATAVFKGIVTAEVSGFATITGGFAVSKSASKLTIAAAGVTAFVGSGDLGVRVTNGKLGAVIKTDTKKFAAVASGDAALEGVAGLTVTGSGSVRINKMGEAVNETITTPSGNVDVVFADGTDILQVRSTLNLQFENFVYASGDFLLEKTQVSDLTTITLAASNLNAFLGVNYGIAGEFGVKVTGAGVAMLIEKQGSNAAKYAISTTGGTVGLVGLAGVDLTGPLALNINRLGRIVDVDIPAPSGVTFPLEFALPDTVQRFGGDLNLNINNFTTLTGTYGFEIETASGATEIRVAGTNINAVLGSNPDGIIGNADDVGARITNAKLGAVLFRSAAGATSYALDAKGTASLAGVSGFTLTGDLAARVNTTGGAVNETITLPNGDTVAVQFAATEAAAVFKGIVTAEVSGFATITGGFAISKSASKLTIAAAGVTAFVGSGNLGVRVTNGKLGAVIKTDTKKFAAVASGDAALEGVSGLTVTGSGSVRLNKMGEAVNETITTPSGNVDIVFADGSDIQQISSTLNLQFENFVYASGDFLLEKTQVSDLTTITLAASNLNAFLGINYGVAGEFGVKVTGAGVAMLIEKQGSNAAKYAISTTGGTVGLVGLAGVDLTGPLALNINRLGRVVDVDIPAPSGVTFPLEFSLPDTVQRFGGDLNLNITNFTTLKGTYGFEIETASGATEIRVAGTNINAVLGSNPDGIIGNADDVSARISNAKLGAVLYRTSAGATSYAVDAKGTASVVGVSGFTLTGDLAARVNTTGGAVRETISMPSGDPVVVEFGATEAAAVFSGTVTAEASGFASIAGAFAAAKNGQVLTIAASDVTAFVGVGGTGVRVTDGELGVVVKTDTKKYALVASGNVALEGVTGLTVTGSGSVRINKLGEAINQTITTPQGSVAVNFADGTDVVCVQSTLNVQFANFVQASGDFLFQKQEAAGLTTITASASNLDAFLGINFNQAGEFGIRLDDAGLAIVIEKATGVDAKFAVSSLGGTVSISGLPSLDLDGPLNIAVNKLGRAIDVDIPTLSGITIPVEFPDATLVQRLAGDVSLSVAGFTTLTGSYVFDLDTSDSSKTKVRVAGTNISALLGSDADGTVGTADDVGARITNGRIGAVFYKSASGTNYALDASGTASLAGISGLTLSGSLAARVNTTGGAVNETITMPSGTPVAVVFAANESAPVFSGAVSADASGFASLSGSFSISKSSTQLIVAAAGVSAFVGSGDTGLRVSDGDLGVVVDSSSKKFALVAGGTVALEGITGFEVSGSAAVRINRLGSSVDQTIVTPGGNVVVSFPTAAEVLQVTGTASLSISDFVDATATITVEKVTAGDLTTLKVLATNVGAFLGTGANTTATSDDMGVRLSNGALDLRFTKNSAANTSYYALAARGTASLVGITDLTLTGTLQAERNTGPSAVTLDFGTTSTGDDLTLAAGAKRFGGSAQLAIGGFVDITASFGFEETTSTVGGVTTTRILVAASEMQTFFAQVVLACSCRTGRLRCD